MSDPTWDCIVAGAAGCSDMFPKRPDERGAVAARRFRPLLALSLDASGEALRR